MLFWWLILCPLSYDVSFPNHVSAVGNHPDVTKETFKIQASEKVSNSIPGQNIQANKRKESDQDQLCIDSLVQGDVSEFRSKKLSNNVACSDDVSNQIQDDPRPYDHLSDNSEQDSTAIRNEEEKKKDNKEKRPKHVPCKDRCAIKPEKKPDVESVRCCMEDINNVLKNRDTEDTIQAIEILEEVLKETEVEKTTAMSFSNLVAIVHKPKGIFKGLHIHASDNKVAIGRLVPNTKVSIQLPKELHPRVNSKIVFCMVNITSEVMMEASDKLYEDRLVGLSMQGRNVSGLQQRVNITMALTTSIKQNQQLSCQFYDFTSKRIMKQDAARLKKSLYDVPVFNRSGCETMWRPFQDNITCSCDHLTYFGVLLISSPVSTKDLLILKYISYIGCGLSLLALVFTVLLFIAKRKLMTDISIKVHLNLTVALILLNLHLFPSQKVATLPSNGPCLYVALLLHYSLIASFSWMTLEGFHLYLLLVKVFNIYFRRYMLKLCIVGWGFPAVVVSVVVIIDEDAYGRVALDTSNANATEICYLSNETVKMVTIGLFTLGFLVNLTMFGIIVKHVVSHRHNKVDCKQTMQDICTLLGVTTLLGITWGLVFFSFGDLTTPGLYAFSILNSLQGFFIFLWFLMSLRKTERSGTKTSTETRSTSS